MITKAQEREALAKIKEIVDSVGTDSYIAMAFEGCLEDAERNIDEDAAYSMKARWESTEKRLAEAKDHIEKLRSECKDIKAVNDHIKARAFAPELVRKISSEYARILLEETTQLEKAKEKMFDLVGNVAASSLEMTEVMANVIKLKRRVTVLAEVKEEVDRHLGE